MTEEQDKSGMLDRAMQNMEEHLAWLKEQGITEIEEAPPPAAADAAEADTLAGIAERIAGCTRCPLHKTRNQTVPGAGHPNPEILFIGEGPGSEEDRQGVPFVGRAGDLLTRMIKRMGLEREDVFIANVVKCRPTVDNAMKRDRPPTPDEMEACLPYLKEQIARLRPSAIITLGNVAMEGLFGFKGITKRRGHWLEFEGIPTMPTYHPSFLLRNGGDGKKHYWEVWEDLKTVLAKIGHPVPED